MGWFPTIYLISCRGGEPAEGSIEVPGSSRRVNTGNKLLFRPYFDMRQQSSCPAQLCCFRMLLSVSQGTSDPATPVAVPKLPPMFAAPMILHAKLLIADNFSLNNEENHKRIVRRHL